MVGKDLPKRRSDLHSPGHLTPIESDDLTIKNEQGCKSVSTAPVPAIQQLSIEGTNLNLIGR
jgi:hypothetical protein